MNFFLVFIGGGFGCVLRFCIGLIVQKTKTTLPWATFISNLIACSIFAVIMWFFINKPQFNSYVKPLVLIGFCGGLSTFSTFGYETFLLFKQGLAFYAVLNILVNTLLCTVIYLPLSKYV